MRYNKTKIVLLNIALLACLGCAPVYLSRPGGREQVLVRVALWHNLPQAVITGGDTVLIADHEHRTALVPGESWTVSAPDGRLAAVTGRATIIAQIAGPLTAWAKGGVLVNGRRVSAAVELRSEGPAGVLAVSELPLEDYVAGVVGAELGNVAGDDIEAAKAQAVASRSYAYARIGSRPGTGYDLESGVSDQSYSPDRAVNPTVQKAVRQTAGLVLVCQGKTVAANYHSCCGGRTSLASEVWNAEDKNFPYIKRVADQFCKISPRFFWHDTIAASEIAAKIFGSAVALSDVAIAQRGPSGRAVALKVSTAAGDTTLYKDRIRSGLASHNLPSAKFDLACQFDSAGNVGSVALRGFGYGHGVGMCQWGAIGMARAGRNYNRILKYYYNDVRIEKLY